MREGEVERVGVHIPSQRQLDVPKNMLTDVQGVLKSILGRLLKRAKLRLLMLAWAWCPEPES